MSFVRDEVPVPPMVGWYERIVCMFEGSDDVVWSENESGHEGETLLKSYAYWLN